MEIGGLAEVAALLQVSKQRIGQLRARPGFPPPIAELSAGPIWDLGQVKNWAALTSPRRAGRPSGSGTRLLGGRFALEGLIGSGGFADVFRATDLQGGIDGREPVVAVKLLREEIADARGRFGRELRLLEAIAHPNVIPVLASGEDSQGRPWYAMPLAKGNLLDELLSIDGPPGIADVLRQVCGGLSHLHGLGIFHRDLTPMNILRTAEGTWALSDFGLAREAERRTATLTTTHTNLGVFFYQAPELLLDFREAGVTSDIFSLGKVLHALELGRHPIPGQDAPTGAFRAVVRRATRSESADRYQSVTEFLGDVERIAKGPKKWEDPSETLRRISENLANRELDPSLLDQLMSIAEHSDPPLGDLTNTMVDLSDKAIVHLWTQDRERFGRAFDLFAREIAGGAFPFSFCDPLANFVSTVVHLTGDDEFLRVGVTGLARLGESHNRFHVRSVLTSILQSIRSSESAVAALDGLREAGDAAIEWNLNEFAMRSLHPVLRDGIQELLPARPAELPPGEVYQ